MNLDLRWLDRLRGRSYVIEQITKDRFLYKERKRSLVIYGEMVSGEFDYVIYSSSIKIWMPPCRQPIAAADKARILKRFQQFMAERAIRYVLDEDVSKPEP